MISWREFRAALAFLLATSLACSPGHALVRLNDSRDHIFVTLTAGVSHDSNVFASAENKGDYVYTAGILAEYSRRAGWIGLNANVRLEAARYGELETENFENPHFHVELTKQSGRTTGSLTLNAARESRADAAVNVRSASWSYGTGLNFRYLINGAYTLSGSVGYDARRYIDETAFANLSTYTASVDLIHIFYGDRDLLAGYRYRYGETSLSTSTTDHAFTVGMTGKLIRGLNGSLRAGYQMRTPQGGPSDEDFKSWTASASISYPFSKRLNFTGMVSKDFSTTANDTSVDATSLALSGQYVYNTHWSLSGSVGWGDSKFLGERGRTIIALGPPLVLGPARHDNHASWDIGLNYSLNEHLKIAVAYSWFRNWSNFSFADFTRSSWSANVSSRW